MGQMAINGSYDDPRRLRELLGRAWSLASEHELSSVVVGAAGAEGDLLFPEVIDFFESALRVDDAIFRMTRERAILFLADVSREQAVEIVERMVNEFRERFTAAVDPEIALGYFEVEPSMDDLSVKQVLPAVFDPSLAS
jgi:hypothetical protein